MSTGMSNYNEIKTAVNVLYKNGLKKKNLCLLQCTSNYPTKISETNLSIISELKKRFKTSVGFSDHTVELETPIFAIFFGAQIIEKHITLNNNDRGPDHKASLNTSNFKKMVDMIKNYNLAVGTKNKRPNKIEIKNSNLVRKSVVAKTNIKKGQKFSLSNLTCKRPGNGLPPIKIYNLIGKKSSKKYEINEQIKLK
jgi:N,N'-diacetyllegionaminate synthase